MKNWHALVFATLSGVLFCFAFFPYGYWWIALFSPAFLLHLWQNVSARQAAIRGFCYGIGQFGVGVYWVFISIHQYGDASILLAGIITTGFILFLALFPALQGYCFQRYFPYFSCGRALIIFPALWMMAEWLRSQLFTGFPWLLLGHSQTTGFLRGFIPILGINGMSFLAALTAGLLWLAAKNIKRTISLICIGLILIGGNLSAHIAWTYPMSGNIPVTLVQGNIAQSIKWEPEQLIKSLMVYQQFTRQHWQSHIIVWPETAIPLLLPEAISLLQPLIHQAQQKKVAIISGVPIPQMIDETPHYFNGAIVMGAGSGYYFKRHLVPFGEYVPLEKWLGKLLSVLQLPMSQFSEGELHQPLLQVAHMRIAPFICYEIAYSFLVYQALPQAQLLVTLSDDAWFNRSKALGQHLQIAQFAAMMSGRYMLVATNSGESAIINPQGKLLRAPIDQATTLTGNIRAMAGITPWGYLGDFPFIFMGGLMLSLGYYFQRKQRQVILLKRKMNGLL